MINYSVYKFQQWLELISKYNKDISQVTPNGIYDDATVKAVEDFQRFVGLPVTGRVDQRTWDVMRDVHDRIVEKYEYCEICAPFENFEFKRGVSGTQVYMLQLMLMDIAKAYGKITPPKLTGVYDEDTEKAVEQVKEMINSVNIYNDIIRIYNSIK